MRVTLRIPIFPALLLALSFAGFIACLVAWFILLSTICSNPRAAQPQTQHVVPYSCHGMTVFISPVDDALRNWLGPAGMLFMSIGVLAGALIARTAARTWRSDADGTRLRIVAIPPGEAPAWVREKWVGLELPLAQSSSGAFTWRSAGVLTGPRGFAARAAGLLRGELREQRGFVVNVIQAIAALERASPEAARWWRTNAPHLMKPSRHFVFPEAVGQLVGKDDASEGGLAVEP